MRSANRLLFLVCALLIGTASVAKSQELNCRVAVNYSQLTGTDFQFLSDIQGLFQEYINDRVWTDDKFLEEERIDCTFQITFLEATGLDRFRVQLTVGSERPIYGSNQITRVFQMGDDAWSFQYVPNQTLLHDPEQYDPITSIIDYYVYIILGFDYDTFSDLGGTSYFQKAFRIAEIAQTSGSTGWEYGSQNPTRGRTIQQILDPRMEPLRRAYFQYHFDGLDHFLDNPDGARQKVLLGLEELARVAEQGNRFYVFDLFFSTKSKEIVGMYLDSNFAQRAYGFLVQMDPSRGTTYDELVN